MTPNKKMNVQRNYAGIFEGMDFGEYSYEHYPLMMTRKSGETRVVEDAEEEAAAKAEGFLSPRVGPPANVTEIEVEGLQNEIEELKKKLARAEAGVSANAPPPKPIAALAGGGEKNSLR